MIYRGYFADTNTNLNNSPDERVFIISIYDTELDTSEYNILMDVADNGNGTQTVTFRFDLLPSDTTSITLGYAVFNVGVFANVVKGFSSPQTLTIPTDIYIYRMVVNRKSGDETYNISEQAITELITAEVPLRRRVTDNAEDKFTAVKGKEVEIVIHSGNGIDISTFATGGDNRWRVDIDLEQLGKTVFTGFLSLSDLSMTFQSDPNEIVLIASDGLRGLDQIPLTDFDGNSLSGEYRLARILAYCLANTGRRLPVYCIMNVREKDQQPITESAVFTASGRVITVTDTAFWRVGMRVRVSGTVSNNGDYLVVSEGGGTIVVDRPLTNETISATFSDLSGHFFNTQYIHSRTFQDDIDTQKNCYEVLEKILAEDAFVTQWKGRHYLMRVDEFDTQSYYQHIFDADGKWLQAVSPYNYYKEISTDDLMAWMNEDAQVTLERPYKEVECELEYKLFDIPNSDFSIGSLSTTISATEKRYNVDHWYLREGGPGAYGTPDSSVYVTRTFNALGYESDRYLVITSRTAFESSSLNDATYMESEGHYIHSGDRVTCSVDWRLSGTIASGISNRRILRLVIAGDDGSFWLLGYNSAGAEKWFNTSVWTANTGEGVIAVDHNVDVETEWKTITIDAPDAPVTGKIYIWLNQYNQDNTAADNLDIYYQNIQFSYLPNINRTFDKYTSQSNKISQDLDTKQKRKKNVYIGDLPKKGMSGALLKISSWSSVHSASVIFTTTNALQISGYKVGVFRKGQVIQISGTSKNNGEYKVRSVSYSIIATATIITVEEIIQTETVSCTIKEAVFSLSETFYNAAVYPNGVPNSTYLHPYGYLQIFSVWNQFNRIMRKFEGTIDRITADVESGSDSKADGMPNIPDLVHKYFMMDPSDNTGDGGTLIKYFQLLHYDMQLHLSEWDGFFHEVMDVQNSKVYDDDWSFKYNKSE